jgi:hypothetical protein
VAPKKQPPAIVNFCQDQTVASAVCDLVPSSSEVCLRGLKGVFRLVIKCLKSALLVGKT